MRQWASNARITARRPAKKGRKELRFAGFFFINKSCFYHQNHNRFKRDPLQCGHTLSGENGQA